MRECAAEKKKERITGGDSLRVSRSSLRLTFLGAKLLAANLK